MNNGLSISQSTPSEMSTVMMSPEEVRDIMNVYSVSIENCEYELQNYRNQTEELEKTK